VPRLGRTPKMWRSHVLAPFETHRISNGGTEAINLIIETTRCLAHGTAPSSTTASEPLLAASGTRPYPTSTRPPLKSESPFHPRCHLSWRSLPHSFKDAEEVPSDQLDYFFLCVSG
jgi:hypothetical protein